tara:strand:- start:1811 stop:2404 length:594 start_codon:yes stop_codon:yes gene_type:complete
MTKKKPKFKRTDFAKYSKLGVRRKKKQVYRKAVGIDNKIRLKMKGHVRNVSTGFRTKKQTRDLIDNLKPIMVHNLNDLKKIKDKQIGIVGKIGSKKRKEVLEQAMKEKIKLSIDVKKALEKIEEKLTKSKEKRKQIEDKKKLRDKKAQKEAEKKAKKQAKEEGQVNKQEEKKEEAKPGENKESGKNEIKSNNYGRGN